ncbi:MAG: apolipoprotein N-acyltransferase [Nitrospirales bacterium]|nr:apolipoprotein N-acyltransferase [Nitrospirales bacterium]
MKSFLKGISNLYGLPLLSGILIALAFPRPDLYPLAWIGMVPLLISLYGKEKGDAFRSGFIFGIVYFFITTHWIYYSINKYGSIPFVPSLLIVLCLSLYLSLYPALFSFLYSSIMRRSFLPAMFVAPVLWTSLEFVRSYAFTGFPWSSLGYSQYLFPTLIQVADITGVYGISFLIVAFNGAIADTILFRKRKEERPLGSLIPHIAGYALLAIAFIFSFSYGFVRLSQEREGGLVRAAVIQGNIEQDRKWDPQYQNDVIATYTRLTKNAAQQKPQLIVWPETSLPFIFGSDAEKTGEIRALAGETGSYLVTGSILMNEKGDKKGPPILSNSSILLDSNGNTSYTYDKIHLVPFGEYVPMRKLLFFLDKLVVGIGDYEPGDKHVTAATPFGKFGTHICYEIVFPGLVRKFYTQGGDFIVTITNDAWFGTTSGPYQHFSMAVFRAVENRKPVVRAANTGISGFIDSNGRIEATTPLFQATSLVRDIKTDRTLSFYTKYGDIFSYLCMVCSLIVLANTLKTGGKKYGHLQ